MDTSDHIDAGFKHLMDWFSLSAAVTTLMGWLPSVGALLPIVWYSIRIYETDTVQGLLGKKGVKDVNDD